MLWTVIDTETTGLPRTGATWEHQPGIVQIGACMIDTEKWTVTRTFQTLVNPEISIWDEKAMEVHGLNPEIVKDAPTFYEALPELGRFITGANCWVGYNISFDKAIIEHQLNRYGFSKRFPWPLMELDVMFMATEKLNGDGKRGNKRWKLVDAYREQFGKDYEGAHGALQDVMATAELAIEWSKT